MGVLPPGVGASVFAEAIREFQAVVGKDWVFTTKDDIELYRDAYSVLWGEAEERIASAAVAPSCVEEVQSVVRIANHYKIPIYAISTGKNLTYGGSAPTYSGSVVLDLKRMNRIIEVDDKRHFAVVEPGVSYFDLYRYIQARGLKVWLDVPDPGWGSPIGNSLDHGIGATTAAFRDHFAAHCGMEVVLANGELMRTGMGALPGAQSWTDFRYGYGPSVDGLFAQGNFGVVTKMGFWLMPEPEAFLVGTISVPRYRDLPTLVEHVNYLEDSGLIGQPSYGSALQEGGIERASSPRLLALMANGWPKEKEIELFVNNEGLPAWNVQCKFYGPVATVKANWAYAQQRVSSAIAGTTCQGGDLLKMPLSSERPPTVPLDLFGIPSLSVFETVARNVGNTDDPPFGHVDFTCVIPRTGEAVFAAQQAFFDAHQEFGVTRGMMRPDSITPFYAPITWFPRTFIMGQFIYTYKDAKRNRKVRELFNKLIDVATRHGWAEYRTAPAFQDKLAAQYSFADHSLRRFTEALKDAVDPNGILSPGRSGIWPKHLRADRA